MVSTQKTKNGYYQKKKKSSIISLHLKYHTTHSRLFVQFNEYPEWLYIGILRS